MITPKKIAIVLGLIFYFIYRIMSDFIDKLEPQKIVLPQFDINTLLENIEKYEFKGTWRTPSNSAMHKVPNFDSDFGTVHMKLFISKMELYPLSFQNMTIESDFSYVFHLRLNDGMTPSKNKHFYRLKIPFGEDLEKTYKFTRKMTFFTSDHSNDCIFQNELTIDYEHFLNSQSLDDLEFYFDLLSQDPLCQTSVQISLKYNDQESNKQVLRFLFCGFLIALYEMALILNFSGNLQGFEYNFKFQSVLFWSSLGMFNCLHCFVYIYNSTDFAYRLPYFLLNATLNFTNFALIILKILHKYARMLHEISRFEEVH